MKSYEELAAMTGTTVDEVRTMMRWAHQEDTIVRSATGGDYEHYELITIWCVGNAGTGCIGSGRTREEAVIYALEHNSQYAKVL